MSTWERARRKALAKHQIVQILNQLPLNAQQEVVADLFVRLEDLLGPQPVPSFESPLEVARRAELDQEEPEEPQP